MSRQGMSRREFLRAGLIGLAGVAAAGTTKVAPQLETEEGDWEERRTEIAEEFEAAQRKPRFL